MYEEIPQSHCYKGGQNGWTSEAWNKIVKEFHDRENGGVNGDYAGEVAFFGLECAKLLDPGPYRVFNYRHLVSECGNVTVWNILM
ncbi:hypothetical protein GUJ93_ZPchr0013g36072 [Zizania palustris]|uniref:Uncharacterized protein n=1 Tax=Zizania palustris TaxID=103762 RepID=A0A8J5WY57_ZIZPA|nr:hypothetical protein GUJ93_ZPchr0013g36072 [Zizania palustris]